MCRVRLATQWWKLAIRDGSSASVARSDGRRPRGAKRPEPPAPSRNEYIQRAADLWRCAYEMLCVSLGTDHAVLKPISESIDIATKRIVQPKASY